MTGREAACVLIVDDDPALLRLLRAVLSHAGYQALTAADGQEALQELGRTNPSLVIVDLNMPRMDGESLLAEAQKAGYDGPFLVVSADFGAPGKTRRLGVPFLAKPFDPVRLLELVSDLIYNGAKSP